MRKPPRLRSGRLLGAFALLALAVPAGAHAQYVAPPPDPGFHYIFDGTVTGSDASFDRWEFAAAGATGGQATVDPVQGAINVGASPFGAYWYPVRSFGDAVLRLQYTVQDTPTSTRNGGIMIRSPEVRYTGATTADVLLQKPTGYSFEVCPGAIPVCGLTAPAPATTYTWTGADGPYPPAPFEYSGAYCARTGTHNVTNLAGTGPLTTNNNANNHRHWTQVYCGHEIQINETLTGGGPQPSTDPIKTGSVYGFRNLNAKQSRTNERLVKGVWHDLEIRMVGQQYTVLIDGALINQFDNSIPKIAGRNGDPPTMARQLPRGYVGLQTHGGNDRISYREIQVKELAAEDIPRNVALPELRGSGEVGRPLDCAKGEWETTGGAEYAFTWYRSNALAPTHPRVRAPSQFDLWDVTTPAEPEFGTQPLRWSDSQVVGHGKRYVPSLADAGRVVHCQVSATVGGATVWATRRAPAIFAAANLVPPVLSGSGAVGTKLVCAPGTWTGTGPLVFRWKRDGAELVAAAGLRHYFVQPADVGGAITCEVARGGSPFVASNAVTATA
jgi:hypothetical protein